MVQLSKLQPGHYFLTGKDKCDSKYVYECDNIELVLAEDGTLTGHVSYSSVDEGNEECTMEGTWSEFGKIEYRRQYSGFEFCCSGGYRDGIFAGIFWIITEDCSSFEQARKNVRGTFRYVGLGVEDEPEILGKFSVNL